MASGSVRYWVVEILSYGADAMHQFIKKHESRVTGTLSGFDRIRFRGTIRMLAYVSGLAGWLNDRRVLLKEFKVFSLGLTDRLKSSVHSIAAAAGRPVRYLASSALCKEDLVRELLRREGVDSATGLVCVLSCVEPCASFGIQKNAQTKHIELVSGLRKCLHWYFYFLDPVLGLCHVRIQSWLPFAVHVCVNGREWLCRELEKAGIGFCRSDNCLLAVDDQAAAQKLLDAQPWADWSGILERLLRQSCPQLLELPLAGRRHEYYWSADDTEWATDIMFRSREALAELYPALTRHAISTLSSCDVMRFLGRVRRDAQQHVHGKFDGQVVSDLKRRPEGLRVKHRVNRNSIKMYDKQGSVLRIETTIQDARDLKVYRSSETDPGGEKSWRILRKAVADLPRRAEVSQAANRRYLAALCAVDATTPLGRIADAARQPIVREGRRFRGLGPLSGPDADVAAIVLRGEFTIHGFRNRDIRQLLHPGSCSEQQRRRQAGQVTRLLRLFREHQLIQKVQGTHRYQLTSHGRQTLPAFLAARNANAEKLNQLAA
jgi:hypothetical protein